jgi:hypothetical protein
VRQRGTDGANAEKEKAAEFEPDGSKWSLAGGAKPGVTTKPD